MRNGRSATARWCLLSLALIAGQGWAGEAWVGDYRVRDAHGERALTLVRDDSRVEYRVEGEPIRVWRQTSDGLELTELYPAERRMIVYAPGDLRTMNLQPDWAQLTGLVDPALRTQLGASGDATAIAQPLTRYRGNDKQGAPVQLDWLAEAALPARYCVGRRCSVGDWLSGRGAFLRDAFGSRGGRWVLIGRSRTEFHGGCAVVQSGVGRLCQGAGIRGRHGLFLLRRHCDDDRNVWRRPGGCHGRVQTCRRAVAVRRRADGRQRRVIRSGRRHVIGRLGKHRGRSQQCEQGEGKSVRAHGGFGGRRGEEAVTLPQRGG